MVTEKRDLTSGLSLWLDRRKQSKLSFGKVLSSIRPEIIVVGTGISGALAADALLSAGFSVLAVNRRKIITGSTSASTALLQFEIDNPLMKLEKKNRKDHGGARLVALCPIGAGLVRSRTRSQDKL